MTEKQLTRRVEWWQKRLENLGIGHWPIEVRLVEGEPHGQSNSSAAVFVPDNYDFGIIEFKSDKINGPDITPRGVDYTIVHELLHLVMRDLAKAAERPSEWMDDMAADLYEMMLHHEFEGVVDRFAHLIVDLVLFQESAN